MTMTDTILFVKEARTCSYVLVIHTPRLCGVPGFKSRRDAREEAYIRCREVVASTADAHADQEALPEADFPFKLPRRKPVLGATPGAPKPGATDADKSSRGTDQALTDIIRQALSAIAGNKQLDLHGGEHPQVLVEGLDGEGEVVIEFLDDIVLDEGAEDGGAAVLHESVAKALRAAGFDVRGEKLGSKEKDARKGDRKSEQGGAQGDPPQTRDEL